MKIIKIVLYLVFISHLSATIINIPTDQPTIQAGIDASVDADTVLVQPNTYYENINFNGKNISLGSLFLSTQDTTFISQTIINGNLNGSVITFISGENSESILTGFTLTEGYAMNGGGINCCNSSPTLTNLIITNNFAGYPGIYDGGGGLHLSNSNAVLENVVISNNESYYCGGGINCRNNSDPIFSNMKILNNLALSEGGGLYCQESSPTFINSVISDNFCTHGGGISCFLNVEITMEKTLLSNNQGNTGAAFYLRDNCNILIINSTIINNTAYQGFGIYCKKNSNPILINSIFWNEPYELICLAGDIEPSSITITYSDIQDGEETILVVNGSVNWLDGNIDDDPLLGWNYYLPASSPCVDTATPFFEWQGNILLNLAPEDYYGISPDMGAYEYGFVKVDDLTEIPLQDCIILQNHPNPFNPSTTINFSIQNDSKINLSIYNIKGQKIKTLAHNEFSKGLHSIIWNGDDESEKAVSSGIFFYRLNVNGKPEAVNKCLLLK